MQVRSLLPSRMTVLRSLGLALAVVAPWALGLATGQAAPGLTASFGAYLLLVSFPHLPEVGRTGVLAWSVLIMSTFAALGGAVTLGSPAFFVGAVMAALAQAAGELRGGFMRLPIALAALAYFLCVGQFPAGQVALYSGCFAVGALLAALVVRTVIPVQADAPAALPLARLFGREGLRFGGGMALASILGSIAACFSPGSHPCWIAAAGLRVLKPTRRQTLDRMKARGLGTLLGALAGGAILSLSPFPWLHVGIVGLLVWAMLIVGAKRYAVWSFCLTAVALAFDLTAEGGLVTMAGHRVLLTVGGIAIAALVLPLLTPTAEKRGT